MRVAAPLQLDRLERVVDHWAGERPGYDPQRCTSARHDGATCRSCEMSCPAAALRIGADRLVEIDPAACTGCDACVAACPTGALASRRGSPTSPIVSCTRAARRRGGSVVSCAAAVGPAQLLALAVDGDVEVLTGECDACPLGEAGAGVAASVARANGVLGALGLPQRVTVHTEPAGSAEPAREDTPAMSRRSFLRSLGAGARTSAAVALAPEPERDVAAWADPERDGRPSTAGAALGSLLGAAGPHTTLDTTGLGAGVPRVGVSCDGCGACAAFCPTAALTLHTGEGGTAALTLDARACVDCGLCESICPRGAITVAREVSAEDLPETGTILWRGSTRRAAGPSGPLTTATAFYAQLPADAGARSQGVEP